jgi:hypothetical protein
VDRCGSCAGPVGAVLRFLDHEKDFLHGALQWHQSGKWWAGCCPCLGKGTGAAQPHPKPGWLQPPRAHARRDPSRVACLTGRPKPHLVQAPCSRHHRPMPPHPSPTYERLRHTIAKRMRMSPIDQPLML